MELRPVKQYHIPKLPTRQIIDEHPELLRLVPRRWQTNPVVLSALAGVCTLMLGSRVLADKQAVSASKVAPIFYHGQGYGGFGCVAINPPVVLSEDEAKKIIEEEANRLGVSFISPGPNLQNALIPTVSFLEGELVWKREPLAVDGQDTGHQIFYEFISLDDMHNWECDGSSFSYFDSRTAARRIREHLVAAQPSGSFAVFYEPFCQLADSDYLKDSKDKKAAWKLRAAEGYAKEKEELTKQVQDFIAWLKTQGVI